MTEQPMSRPEGRRPRSRRRALATALAVVLATAGGVLAAEPAQAAPTAYYVDSVKGSDAAAGTMDFASIRGEVAALRSRVDATPRAGTLFMTAIVTAILTVALTVLVLRFGVPGLFGSLLVR